MNPVITPNTLQDLEGLLKEKSRLHKCVLHKDRQTLLIKLANGKNYTFQPTREMMVEHWENSYTKSEADNCKEWECYDLEVWNSRERAFFASMYKKEWKRVKLKEVPLTKKVQNAINKAVRKTYKKGRYTCTEIIRKYTPEGNAYSIVGEFEGIGLIVEAKSLQGAVDKLLANVRQIATAMNLQEMKVA